MHIQLLTTTHWHPPLGRGGIVRLLFCLLAMPAALLAAPGHVSPDLEEGYAAVLRSADGFPGPDHDWRARAAHVEKVFNARVQPQVASMHTLSTGELRTLLQATRAAATAIKTPRYSALALAAGERLRERGALLPADIRDGAAIAMITRDGYSLTPSSPWSPAFAGRPLPRLPEGIRPFEYWTPLPGTGSYGRAVADMRSLDVVVISHPGCGFSRAAVDAAKQDPALHGLLSGARALWISPQDGTLDPEVFIDWTANHPDFPIHVVARQSGFAGFGYWGTPTFYILRDGKVTARVVGWPRDGNRAALLQAFSEAGIRSVGTP
jgi:hypothetical protein